MGTTKKCRKGVVINSASGTHGTGVSRRVLTLAAARREKEAAIAQRVKNVHELTRSERLALHALLHDRQSQGSSEEQDMDSDGAMMDDVLAGRKVMETSHGGGEMGEVLDDLTEDFRERARAKRRKDGRTRRDRTQRRTNAFQPQMRYLLEEYLNWTSSRGDTGMQNMEPSAPKVGAEPSCPGWAHKHTILVIDLFWRKELDITVYSSDASVASALIRHGLLPVSVLIHTYAISTRTMELFRTTRLRCPQLSVEAFVRTLNDFHLVPTRTTIPTQFAIAYDVLEDLLAAVDKRVEKALLRDDINHRLKNCCPCCTYELEGEAELIYHILFCMDGNDSLKRVYRSVRPTDSDAPEVPRESAEREDRRADASNYFLSREKVMEWSKERIEELLGPAPPEEEDPGLCEGRWHNMKSDLVSKMWGIFEETGIFLALCRHGFVLVAADMIKSGELAQYGLAVVAHLVKVLGAKLGCGYDIGCQFGVTVRKSPLGDIATELGFKSLVGLFHGHAHNRLCQLSFLPRYVKGVGLEDFEGCERMFGKTNALAAVTRYASPFHRKRLINGVFRRKDVDTYEALSKFLLNNYAQALELQGMESALEATMAEKCIDSRAEFDVWLSKEKVHLQGLLREPPEESLQMEYLGKLELLAEAETQLENQREGWNILTPETISRRDYTASVETARRHTQEKRDRALEDVQVLEVRMGIEQRWTTDMPLWIETEKLRRDRVYRRALDVLERLVISRLFELTKMNQSQTGYKLRKHIANALRTRSQAIRTALERYNAAAQAFSPPKPSLTWDQVVEYGFLSDFDLLRDSRTDIREEIWTKPWARLLMDQHFKIVRAKEEIARLNIEIPRFITWIHDEDEYLEGKRREWEGIDPRIAFQIDIYRRSRARFNARHLQRFAKFSLTPGFSASLVPGKRKEQPLNAPSVDMDVEEPPPAPEPLRDGPGAKGDDDDDDEDEDDDTEQDQDLDSTLAQELELVARISDD